LHGRSRLLKLNLFPFHRIPLNTAADRSGFFTPGFYKAAEEIDDIISRFSPP
jgi:hypothetical protein